MVSSYNAWTIYLPVGTLYVYRHRIGKVILGENTQDIFRERWAATFKPSMSFLRGFTAYLARDLNVPTYLSLAPVNVVRREVLFDLLENPYEAIRRIEAGEISFVLWMNTAIPYCTMQVFR